MPHQLVTGFAVPFYTDLHCPGQQPPADGAPHVLNYGAILRRVGWLQRLQFPQARPVQPRVSAPLDPVVL